MDTLKSGLSSSTDTLNIQEFVSYCIPSISTLSTSIPWRWRLMLMLSLNLFQSQFDCMSSCFQWIVTLKSTIQDVKVRGQISYFLFIVCYFVTSFFIFYCYLEEHNTRSQSQKTDHAHNQGNIILAGKLMVIMISKMWMWRHQTWWQLLMVLVDRIM